MILIDKTSLCYNNGIASQQTQFSNFKFWLPDKETLEKLRNKAEKTLSKKHGKDCILNFVTIEIPDDYPMTETRNIVYSSDNYRNTTYFKAIPGFLKK